MQGYRLWFVLVLVLALFFIGSARGINRVEIGNLVLEDVPSIPEALKVRLIKYQNVRSASFLDWDPKSEGILIGTRFGETNQVYLVQQPMGMRKQITFFDEPIYSGSFCPDKNRYGFLYSKDTGGSESAQIFYYDIKTGNYKMLTDGISRNGSQKWSNKGDKFSFYSTKRNQRDMDIYIATVDNPEKAELVLQRGGAWAVVDWSPDDSKLLVFNFISINEIYYYILDFKTRQLTPIKSASDKKIAYRSALFSRDGKGVYLTSDGKSEYQQMCYYDIKSKKITPLISDKKWDIDGFALSNNGKYLAYKMNEGGFSKLHLLDLTSKKEINLPEITKGVINKISFSPDSRRLSMEIDTPTSPGDIYIYNLKRKSFIRWTKSELGGLNPGNFVAPKLIHYPTFDKEKNKVRKIPAFVYKPDNKKGPFPVVIDIHGGPEEQERPTFSSFTQFLINELGVVLIFPNVRGSKGYGKSYIRLDNGYKREDSVKDIGKLIDWIAKQPDLDADRVAVFGGSYGGYMVLSSMTHYNNRIRCGIDVVGISNFVTFLKNTKGYRRDLRRVEYGDERNPKMRDFLSKISPTANAKKITKPLFVVQGLNDPRVPVTEAEQIVDIIRKNGGEVWYMLAKDEGHGFRKKTNLDHYMAAMIMFLEKYLIL